MRGGQRLYRVVFQSQGSVYELYARQVSQGGLLGFIEVSTPVFGERSKVLIDPGEDRLKNEFQGVKRFYVPLHSVIRVDEVEREGVARITAVAEATGRVSPFPVKP